MSGKPIRGSERSPERRALMKKASQYGLRGNLSSSEIIKDIQLFETYNQDLIPSKHLVYKRTTKDNEEISCGIIFIIFMICIYLVFVLFQNFKKISAIDDY